MEEVVKTHLPLLAWRQADGRYRLIYDDLAVGELTIDSNGLGRARYHDKRWTIEQSSPTRSVVRQVNASQTLGTLELSVTNPKGAAGGPEEGLMDIEGRAYRCLRDSRKIPPKMTISSAEGRPLLQFREEDEGHGRIQIDDQKSASSADFEIVVLWGLYLYARTAAATEAPALERPLRPVPRTLEERLPHSGGPTPPVTTENKTTGGEGGGDDQAAFWLTAAAGAILVGALFALGRRVARTALFRR